MGDQGAAPAVRGRHSCGDPGGSTGSQGPVLLGGGGPRGNTGSQGPTLLWALTVKGQHLSEGPGGSTGSQGPTLLWALTVKGQHLSEGPGGSTGRSWLAPLPGSNE